MHGLCAVYTEVSIRPQKHVIGGGFEHRSSLISDQNSLYSSHRPPLAIISYSVLIFFVTVCTPRNEILPAPLLPGRNNDAERTNWTRAMAVVVRRHNCHSEHETFSRGDLGNPQWVTAFSVTLTSCVTRIYIYRVAQKSKPLSRIIIKLY